MTRDPRDPGNRDPGERRMPFGYNRGVMLREIATRELQKTRDWCREREDEGKNVKSLMDAIDEVLQDRLGLPLGLEERE